MAKPTDENIVTPVQLSKELEIRPQMIFSWVRQGSLPSHQCVCGHTYLVRDEVKAFLDEREAKKAEREAKKVAATGTDTAAVAEEAE